MCGYLSKETLHMAKAAMIGWRPGIDLPPRHALDPVASGLGIDTLAIGLLSSSSSQGVGLDLDWLHDPQGETPYRRQNLSLMGSCISDGSSHRLLLAPGAFPL